MTEQATRSELLRELKNYLLFLKECGYTEAPYERDLSLTPALPSPQQIATPTRPDAMTPPKTAKPKAELLSDIRAELGDCQRCKLCEGRNSIVFGSGNPQANLVFVGEGPGKDEDAQGLPFVGRAGKKLTEIIEKGMQLNREQDTYICNIVKCRPPGNRDPERDEVEACKPFSHPAAQGDPAQGDRRAGETGGHDAARPGGGDHQGAGHLARVRGHSSDADVSPGLPAAVLHGGKPARGDGRHEQGF